MRTSLQPYFEYIQDLRIDCNACGYEDAKSRVSQSLFVCSSCGIQFNTDCNAAKNIVSRAAAHYRQREALACA